MRYRRPIAFQKSENGKNKVKIPKQNTDCLIPYMISIMSRHKQKIDFC